MKEGLINYKQGMLLKPQHFQLESRFHQENLHRLSQLLNPYLYGVCYKEISSDALSAQKIAVPKGSFIFADGTYCEIDKNAILLPKAIPSEFLELGEKVDVYIGLKEFSENSANVTEINNKEEAADCNTRYIGFYEGKEVCDLYGQGLPSYVDVIKYNLQIVFATD